LSHLLKNRARKLARALYVVKHIRKEWVDSCAHWPPHREGGRLSLRRFVPRTAVPHKACFPCNLLFEAAAVHVGVPVPCPRCGLRLEDYQVTEETPLDRPIGTTTMAAGQGGPVSTQMFRLPAQSRRGRSTDPRARSGEDDLFTSASGDLEEAPTRALDARALRAGPPVEKRPAGRFDSEAPTRALDVRRLQDPPRSELEDVDEEAPTRALDAQKLRQAVQVPMPEAGPAPPGGLRGVSGPVPKKRPRPPEPEPDRRHRSEAPEAPRRGEADIPMPPARPSPAPRPMARATPRAEEPAARPSLRGGPREDLPREAGPREPAAREPAPREPAREAAPRPAAPRAAGPREAPREPAAREAAPREAAQRPRREPEAPPARAPRPDPRAARPARGKGEPEVPEFFENSRAMDVPDALGSLIARERGDEAVVSTPPVARATRTAVARPTRPPIFYVLIAGLLGLVAGAVVLVLTRDRGTEVESSAALPSEAPPAWRDALVQALDRGRVRLPEGTQGAPLEEADFLIAGPEIVATQKGPVVGLLALPIPDDVVERDEGGEAVRPLLGALGQAERERLLIGLDRGTSARTLARVLYSAWRAGYRRSALVLRRGEELVSLELAPHRPGTPLPAAGGLVLRVGQLALSAVVEGRDGRVVGDRPPPLPRNADDTIDLAALDALLDELASSHPRVRDAVIHVNGELPVEVLVGILSRVRGSDQRDRFPSIALAVQ
jgi:hypothetical protein